MNFWPLYLIASSSLWRICHCEVYSSAADMKQVFRLEIELVDILNEYSAKLRRKLDKIDDYISEVDSIWADKSNADSQDDYLERLSGNPIHAYKLMKRFSVDWKGLENEIRDIAKDDSEVELKLKQKKLSYVKPREEDLHGSAEALLRIHDVYHLDVRDLANGIVKTVPTNAKLNSKDCFVMGKHSFNSGNLANSLEWFEQAWILAGQERNETITQDQVQNFLDYVAKEHDERVLNGERNDNLFPKPVYDEPPFRQRQKLRQRELRPMTDVDVDKSLQERIEGEHFNALCRGNDMRSPEYISKLKCYSTTRDDPYYYLQPMAVEVAHLKPRILLFHDILSESEMRIIRELAQPYMMRSQVQNAVGGIDGSKVSMTRTSKTGWLQDNFHPIVSKVSRRVRDYTGLSADTRKSDAELLQIANYINGGHYNPHHDYIHKGKDANRAIYGINENGDSVFLGDRIATWMIYMNNVSLGGKTAFPKLGVAVNPVPGAAVFWYNLLSSGDADRETLHGACPVLLGTKWVGNKWITEGGQLFNRPCGLTKEE